MPKRERWRFEWLRRWDEVFSPDVERRWTSLVEASSSAHVYHRPSIVRAWAESIGRGLDADPMVGIGTASTGVSAILPWVVVRRSGRLTVRRTLEPAGADIFGYHNPLVAGADPAAVDWNAFWQTVRAALGGECDQALFRLLQPIYVVDCDGRVDSEQSPILELDGADDLDAVLARCSSRHRVDVKRQRRRLSDRGEVSLWVAPRAGVEQALASVRRGLLPAYRAIWSRREPTSPLLDSRLEDFLERTIVDGLPDGWTHVSELRVGGSAIAWHVGFVDRGRLYWWLPTYDTAWSACSPGKLLLAEIVGEACRRRWREIHLLAGDQFYKTVWNPTPQPLAAIAWTAPTVRGRLMAFYDAMRRAS